LSQFGISIVDLKKGTNEIVQDTDDPKAYSSGSNESNDGFEKKFSEIKSQEEKEQRVKFLWSLAYRKAKGASIIIARIKEKSQKLFLNGFSDKRNITFRENP